MRIFVIGAGRWGSFIAWYLNSIGHSVSLYGRKEDARFAEFRETRTNGTVTMPPALRFTTDLPEILSAGTVVISVPSQSLRGLMEELRPLALRDRTFVLCMKGLEIGTGKRLSEVVAETSDPSNRTAVWLGPGHPQEFVRGVPNCMVLDSVSDPLKHELIDAFSSPLIRFYYGADLVGNELGAATKNVIGIAAGMLDGLGLSSLKGALMSRGTREIARLIAALGGKAQSAYGLCHLGDYEATVFSKHSHNRGFGEAFVAGRRFPELAEGAYTARAVHAVAARNRLDLPICEAVHSILYEKKDPKQVLDALFLRSLKSEF